MQRIQALVVPVWIAMLGIAAAVMGQDYTPADGLLRVHDSGVFTLHDEARDKDLSVRVRFPDPTEEEPGPFPLIVFSHGMGGSADAFASLSTYLAGHGYVVVHPTHADSVSLGSRKEQRQRARTLLRDPAAAVQGVDLPGRVADVKFLLDSIGAIEKQIEREGLVDRERLGMAGHSAGAMTTQALGGLGFVVRGRARNSGLVEPRFDAFAVISGQGTNRAAITEDSWAEVDKPWLVITGSEDTSRASNETPESRRHPYDYAPADGTKYLLFIEGATHSSYQGKGPGALLDGRVPDNLGWVEEVTNMGVLAFFDAYIKAEPDAEAWLRSGEIAGHEGGELEFQHK